MLNPAGNCLLLFDSIHHVLTAERAFLQRGVWHDLVPTPRDLHTDCGMVVQFREADREAVFHLLLDLDHRPNQAYRIIDDGYQPLDLFR